MASSLAASRATTFAPLAELRSFHEKNQQKVAEVGRHPPSRCTYQSTRKGQRGVRLLRGRCSIKEQLSARDSFFAGCAWQGEGWSRLSVARGIAKRSSGGKFVRKGGGGVRCRADDGGAGYDLSLDPAPAKQFGSRYAGILGFLASLVDATKLCCVGSALHTLGGMRCLQETGRRVCVGKMRSKLASGALKRCLPQAQRKAESNSLAKVYAPSDRASAQLPHGMACQSVLSNSFVCALIQIVGIVGLHESVCRAEH